MEGSTSSPPSVLNILRQLQTLGFCSNLNPFIEESNKKSQSSLFDRILSAFLEETHQHQEIPSIPAKLRNDKSVDLFLLYQEVLENGGCDSITTSRQWGSVAKKIGYNSRDGLRVELVYLTYLDEFNRRLHGTSFNSKNDEIKNSSLLDDDDYDVILDSVEAEREISRVKKGKRKREYPQVGMLDWLLSVSRRPWDPFVGNIEEDSVAHLMFSQLLRAREAMFHEIKPVCPFSLLLFLYSFVWLNGAVVNWSNSCARNF